MNAAKFFVSRQRPYYQEGIAQVEVAQGGLAYSGADMLVAQFSNLGEGQEFTGLRPAVDAAIAVALAWKSALSSKEDVYIAVGCTHGMFTELEGEPLSKELIQELIKNADEFDEKLPKCEHCGELLENKVWFHTDDPDMKFCSEFCCEESEREWQKELAAEDAAMEDE